MGMRRRYADARTGPTHHLHERARDLIHPFGSSAQPPAVSDRASRLVRRTPARVRHTLPRIRQTLTPRQTTRSPRQPHPPARLHGRHAHHFRFFTKPANRKGASQVPAAQQDPCATPRTAREAMGVRATRTGCTPCTNRVSAVHEAGVGRAQTGWRPCTNRVAAMHEPGGGRGRTGWRPCTSRVAAVHEPRGAHAGTEWPTPRGRARQRAARFSFLRIFQMGLHDSRGVPARGWLRAESAAHVDKKEDSHDTP
jgi:hypothetical protein